MKRTKKNKSSFVSEDSYPSEKNPYPRNDGIACYRTKLGRSMIEMLGVLAIIGVLSAGGIAGYSAAMENYKINKTIQTITLSAAQMTTFIKKRTDGNGAERLDATKLCQLGILPSDICKTVTGTIAKGYFGESLQIYAQTDHKGVTGTYSVETEEGILTLSRPETYFRWVPSSVFSLTACAKLVSYKGWIDVTEIAAVKDLGVSAIQELPLSPEKAYNQCKSEFAAGGVIFAIIIWTDIADISA